MSRTDQHAPFAIKIARGDLPAVASHDHRYGPCDLPDRSSCARMWSPMSRCRWEFQYTGTGVCSCWMCHAGPQRRAERRAARHRDRIDLDVAAVNWRNGDRCAFDEIKATVPSRWR
ncbi:hypothetical protein [Jatrophihabitans sp. GAS493]|uniref:hypothetical protein n=1 Tax=Jatrophihabitans sp. GAS493 TaxID=1907575 RepID=UPI0012FD5DD2|nr:hypothetical protein [Jatrophihabitans sp. GAS493]